MKAMAASWHWHPMATVRSAALALFVGLLAAYGLPATGQDTSETRWAASDTARLSVLIEDGALAADWQPLTMSAENETAALTAHFQHGPRIRELTPALTLPFSEAGLSTAILYVFPESAVDRFDEQKAQLTVLAGALEETQTLVLVHATEAGWRVMTELAGSAPAALRETALAALTAPEPGEAEAPAEVMDSREEHRQFVILGAGEAATEALAALSEARGERHFVNTVGFAQPLPDGFTALGDMSDQTARENLFAFMSAGDVAVFDMETSGTRLPGEADGATVLALDLGTGEIPLRMVFPANLPAASAAALISPFNGLAWLGTPGRRHYGLINLAVWGLLIGGLVWLVRRPRGTATRDAPVLARIELYGLGLSADVRYLPFTIGRSAGCDLVAPHEETSRRHAQIRRNSAGELELVDLMSANGTFLDGDRLNQPTALGSSQAVTFGGVRGHIHVLDPAKDPALTDH